MTGLVAQRADPTAGIAPEVGDGSWWAAGLTLAERRRLPATSLSADRADRADRAQRAGRAEGAGQAERAGRRLARWREVYWRCGLDQLAEVMAPDTNVLTEPELRALLAEEPVELAGRAECPAWARWVEQVLAAMPVDPEPLAGPAGDHGRETAAAGESGGGAPVTGGHGGETPATDDEAADDEAAGWAGLSAIVAPFVDFAVERLEAGVAAIPAGIGVDLAAVRAGLAAGLRRRLVLLAGRTLVLELHVHRTAGRLTGDTPRQRFWSFVAHHRRLSALARLLGEYPVLARLLVESSVRAAQQWTRLAWRLAVDWRLLADGFFGGVDPGRLVSAESIDRGYDQRGAALLRFSSGAMLAYRTAPVGAWTAFGELIDWLGRRLPDLTPQLPVTVHRGDYGWLEWTPHRPPGDAAGTESLRYRWGGLLAVLHLLGARDLQSGDVAARDNLPILADLTGLMHPPAPLPASDPDPAQEALAVSVRRVRALPEDCYDEYGALPWDRYDEGGALVGGLPRYEALVWEAPGTDQMRLVAAPPGGRQARPAPAGWSPALLAGFRAAYDTLVAGRDELAGPNGPLSRMNEAELRFRPHTNAGYQALLADSVHPDLLRDALDRDRLLYLRWRAPVPEVSRRRLAASELAQLRAATLPWFTSMAGSHHLWTDTGVRITGVLPQTGLDWVAARVREMGPGDLARQEAIIHAWSVEHPAGAGTAAVGPHLDTASPPAGAAGVTTVDPARCLASARRLADQLDVLAYRRGGRAAWLGLTSLDEHVWRVRPLGVGLDGFPGVALFLARLAELSGEDRYATLARQALAHLPEMWDSDDFLDGASPPVGGPFHGYAGLWYALVQIAACLGDPTLIEGAGPSLAAAVMVANDAEPGVLGGPAGTIAAMLAIDATAGSPPARRIAQFMAVQLIELMARSPSSVRQVLGCLPAGFARGTPGIGWALLRYAGATGDQRAAATGSDVLALARVAGAPARPGWCRGATGSGLAWLDSFEQRSQTIAELPGGDPAPSRDGTPRAEVDMAVRAVLAAGPRSDHSLCHGELGCLELLTTAVGYGWTELIATRDRRANRLLDELDAGPRCGTPGAVVTPGLLTGLAGIGYGLLRLGFPDRVPSVLSLDPPGVGSGR